MNSQQEELGRKKINSGEERKKWRGGEGKRRKKIRAAIRYNSFAIFPFLFPSIFIFIFHLFIYLYIYFFTDRKFKDRLGGESKWIKFITIIRETWK